MSFGNYCARPAAGASLALVAAPRGLCGDGEVIAIGTWLWRPKHGGAGNDRFIANLSDWLTSNPVLGPTTQDAR